MLDALNVGDDGVERTGQALVHGRRVITRDQVWLVAIAMEEGREFVIGDAG
jgi:hypothetical protein